MQVRKGSRVTTWDRPRIAFTDSFAARGKNFSITFRGTEVASFTLAHFAGVATTKGLFGDGITADG
jgi:hypothetical protein